MNLTAADIRAALKRRYAAPDFAVVFEVAQATGFKANRHLDAVVMDTWPSRGLELHGVEIKVSKGDWRRELANPAKAEEVARFCDRFSVAAPKGIIDVAEVPLAWGLLEVDDAGALSVKKSADRHEAQPVTKAFLAAMMRASCRPIDPDSLDGMLKARIAEVTRENEDRIKFEAEQLCRTREAGNQHWRALIEAIGDRPSFFYRDAELIKAIKLVMASGIAGTYSGVGSLVETIERTAAELRQAAKDAGVDLAPPTAADRAKRYRRAA